MLNRRVFWIIHFRVRSISEHRRGWCLSETCSFSFIKLHFREKKYFSKLFSVSYALRQKKDFFLCVIVSDSALIDLKSLKTIMLVDPVVLEFLRNTLATMYNNIKLIDFVQNAFFKLKNGFMTIIVLWSRCSKKGLDSTLSHSHWHNHAVIVLELPDIDLKVHSINR